MLHHRFWRRDPCWGGVPHHTAGGPSLINGRKMDVGGGPHTQTYLYLLFYTVQRVGKKQKFVRFQVYTAVTMKNVVLWDIKPSSYFTGDTLRLRYIVQPINAM
jgi:hypothetical protein